jgi:hypothetical protein
MAGEFKKGQTVNVFIGSFETAQVRVTTYTVASCGAKQLHMIRADGSNAEFRMSAPFRGERRYHDVQCASVDPVAHTLTLRRQFAARTREHYEDRTRIAERLLREGSIGARGYADAIAKGRAKFEAATADL